MRNEIWETKTCKYCQTEIPKAAKICPNCRKRQGKRGKVILTVMAIILLISVFGGNDDVVITNGEAEQDSTKTQEETKGDKIVRAGGSFEKNGLKITVNEINADFQEYDNEYGWNTPEDGMKYIMASLTYENNGNSDAYVSIYDFYCYADDTMCEQQYTLDNSDFINANISSGRNVSFKIYYAVPINSETVELEYTADIWTNEKVTILVQ